MNAVSSFPHISITEFEQACEELCSYCNIRVHNRDAQSSWQSVDIIHLNGSRYLKVIKILPNPKSRANDFEPSSSIEEVEEDDDEAALSVPSTPQALVEYSITLSPSYRVPVLYFQIRDPLFRYPMSQETLYAHLIPTQYKSQTESESVGVLGGITVADHPFTNAPAFFIHPCQTAAVLEASREGKEVTPLEYLKLWIGAIGGYVGLNVPLALMSQSNGARTA